MSYYSDIPEKPKNDNKRKRKNDDPLNKPERGVWLKLYLILTFLVLIVPTLGLFCFGIINGFSLMFSPFGCISVIGIWNWQRWGIWGLIITNLAASVFFLAEASTIGAFISLCSIVAILALVHGKWHYFD